MSTEITARLYFDAPPAPAWLFAQLREAVTVWHGEPPSWQRLRSEDPSQLLTTQIAFPCWRFHGREPEHSSSVAWVEAWGEEYGRTHGEDRRVGGSAAFSIMDCGPYCALIDATDAAATTVNERVEDNLERLTQLVFRIVEGCRPSALKVFTDQGAYLPFNAHLAYYESADRLVDDVRLIAELWRRGLPRHSIEPLAEIADAYSIAFHWWRDGDARRRLQAALAARIDRSAAVTTADVARVLESGAFDNYSVPPGFVVLDYPHFLNAFLDRFFLALLEG